MAWAANQSVIKCMLVCERVYMDMDFAHVHAKEMKKKGVQRNGDANIN